uniref:Uncharacterized protein n=1 Tax=Oryza meridionalis TaxID=40149 RepID=A0A0E0E316_9ORYZ
MARSSTCSTSTTWFLPPEDRTSDSGSGGGMGSEEEEDEAWDEWLAKPIHERMPWQMPPATELQDVGVTFRAKRSPCSLVDATFSRRDGVLEIPTVENYANCAIPANLVAYEQNRGRWKMQRVASYVLLMSSVAAGGHEQLLRRAVRRPLMEKPSLVGRPKSTIVSVPLKTGTKDDLLVPVGGYSGHI